MKEFIYKQTVGIKRGLKLKGNDDERNIAIKFSKFFGITFSRQGKFKTTDYTIDFLQPDEKFRESFNMFNEVLLLFSPYTVFERRTLDFIDKTLSEYDNRLDKVCIFIVSKDNNISDEIKQINTENKDSKIMVPFTYKEVLNNDFNKIRLDNKLRKYFYNRDLFALESPLKTDTYFFGRNNIIQSFYDKYSLGEQCGLFGLRKIGKTSVLFALERLIKLRGGNSLYLDCQNPAIHKCRWNELLYYIISEIVRKYNLDVNLINTEDKYTEKSASQSFEEDISKISMTLNERRILLIFDEIENITFGTSTSEFWSEGHDFINFWQTIRAVFQKDNRFFSFIITGVNPMCVERPSINGFDNPIFGMINPTYLDLFNIKDVRDMIKNIGKYMGVIFEEEIFTKLTDDYGGHPFLIRHVCSLINTEVEGLRPHIVTKYEYSRKKNEYDKKISNYIELILQILERWYPQEYELLEILAVYGNEKFKDKISSYNNEIQHLVGYGILKEDNNDYFITINAVKQYIKERCKLREKPDSEESVWKKVCGERNRIESRMRRLVVINLLSKYGRKKLKEKLIEFKETSQKERLMNKEITDIIENNFYLLDFKILILKNWDNFNKIFDDKSKFELFIDLINKYRIDAHAKKITEEDYAILMIAFKWINESLEDIV
ncbi:ATP-binding protein [Clostridium butyricum]